MFFPKFQKPASPGLRIQFPGAPARIAKLPTKRSVVGSWDQSDIWIEHDSIAPKHSLIELSHGKGFVHPLKGEVVVNGVAVTDWTEIPMQGEFKIGESLCTLIPNTDEVPWFTRLAQWKADSSLVSFIPSLAFHLLFLLVLSQLVLFSVQEKKPEFQTESSSFLSEDSGQEAEAGGEAADGPITPEMLPTATAEATEAMLAMLTTTAPTALTASVPTFGAASLPASVTARTGGGGRSFRSAGFGAGSGIGKGVGEWIGGGSGGIGISGRGKNLKTLKEFSVYFVIHSGDWYAALDTREAPSGRQREISPPGLPDSSHINWGNTTPTADTGPFINYFWGYRSRSGSWDDCRGNLVEFTPGAMGNLLKFVRMASANNIKGSPKPSAVVLDRSLVPYTIDKAASTITWHEEGREKLRETMRKGLPVLDNFYGGAYGYIWNPQPLDREHPDFTVEYLLDVKPMPPFIYFTGNDEFTLSDAEVETLYQYILRGGAIWGDSGFSGKQSKFDTAFKREMKRVIPDDDKPFRTLRKQGDLFVDGPDAYFDKSNGFNALPHGLQFYDSPIEVIEVMPGVVSVVATKNGYGNLLRFETAVVNNQFSVGGELGRGTWADTMWNFRNQFFRGLDEDSIIESYKLGTNILVYMLGRWPAVLNRPENRGRMP